MTNPGLPNGLTEMNNGLSVNDVCVVKKNEIITAVYDYDRVYIRYKLTVCFIIGKIMCEAHCINFFFYFYHGL